MSDIRTYIDLIERAEMSEAFGKAAPVVREPTDPIEQDQLDDARRSRYRSAHEFAMNHNRYYPWNNYDPERIRIPAEQEHDKLMARWENWRRGGLI